MRNFKIKNMNYFANKIFQYKNLRISKTIKSQLKNNLK